MGMHAAAGVSSAAEALAVPGYTLASVVVDRTTGTASWLKAALSPGIRAF